MNILLVEDDLLFAKGTAKLIERLSAHKVKITIEPDNIFKWCQEGRIDLVAMDINLPGFRWKELQVSGIDLTRSLKENPQTASIPIILLSTYAMKSKKPEILEISKADYFWTKPITNYDKLIQQMEQLVQRNFKSEKYNFALPFSGISASIQV